MILNNVMTKSETKQGRDDFERWREKFEDKKLLIFSWAGKIQLT